MTKDNDNSSNIPPSIPPPDSTQINQSVSNPSNNVPISIPVESHNFNGNTLVKDEATGYLTSPYLYTGLTAHKKVLAVKIAQDLWPNVTAIAKSVGVSRVTLTNHMAVDDKFRMDLQAIANDHLDTLEQTMMDQGKQPRGYMDRITMLRAYRKERWNPDSHVTINHTSSLSPQDRAKRVGEVMDGELIDSQKEELG